MAERRGRWRRRAPSARSHKTAGVLIEIVEFDGIYAFSDQALDYAFELAKALGARAISTEICRGRTEASRRLRRQARDDGRLPRARSDGPRELGERCSGYATHNGANLDIGHFVSGNHGSPIPFLEAHHDRITHIHVKDRKVNKGANVPFGQGDTPIAEALRLIRDNKWNIQATIEFGTLFLRLGSDD